MPRVVGCAQVVATDPVALKPCPCGPFCAAEVVAKNIDAGNRESESEGIENKIPAVLK